MHWVDRIGRRLKLRDVNILLAVVQWGSMAKAAERLAISQPVVSKAIADLEHTLGVRLLDRGRQGVEATPYGRALLNRGLAAFDELRQCVKEIEFLSDPTIGEVRIGAPESMVAGLLSVVIERLYGRYPRLSIHLTQTPSGPALYQALRARTVDFTLGRLMTPTLDKDLSSEILFDEPIYVVAGTQNRWANRRKIELSDLVEEPWILPPSDTFPGQLIADTFRACGLDVPHAAVTSNSVHLSGILLATGNFLAMFPRSLLRFGGERLSIKRVPVTSAVQHSPVAIVTLKNRTPSPATLLAVDCIRKVAKPLART